MTDNSFSNENIFLIPIDQNEENSNDISNETENADDDQFILSESEIKTDTSFSDESDLEKKQNNLSEKYFNIVNAIKRSEDTMNECKYIPQSIAYSSIKDDREIKSLTNSSKLYVCEFLNYNWKNRTKRFVIKNKIKYIELIKKMEE